MIFEGLRHENFETFFLEEELRKLYEASFRICLADWMTECTEKFSNEDKLILSFFYDELILAMTSSYDFSFINDS